MAIPGFDFPGVTLSQSFETQAPSTASTLGVACVGPQYKLHGFDIDADAVFVTDSEKYDASSGLGLDKIPGCTGTPSEETINGMGVYVHDGVFAYATVNTGLTVDDNKIKTTTTLAASENFTVNSKFGTRGVRVGDPVILTGAAPAEGGTPAEGETTDEGETTAEGGAAAEGVAPKALATVLGIFSDATYGYCTIAVERAALKKVGNTVTSIEFCVLSDARYGSDAITKPVSGDDLVEIQGGLSLDIEGVPDAATLQSGSFFMEYKERALSYVGTLGTLSSVEDIETTLGKICPDNPLAAACYFAFMAGNNTTVYFTAVKEDTASDYEAALDFLNNYDGIYSIVPCTSDVDIVKACMQMCISASNDIDNSIRRTLWYGIDHDDMPIMASGTATATGPETDAKDVSNNEVVVTFTTPILTTFTLDMSRDKLKVGTTLYDIIKTNDTDTVTVSSKSELSSNVTMSIVRTLPTNDNIIDNLISKREARSTSERGQCVWGDTVLCEGYEYDNYVLAAAAAGMRAYEPCHRPLSNLGYNFFSLANAHGFTLSQLRRLGANGVWIIAENSNGLPVNKRQITTAVSTNLNLNEESIVANADSVALAVAGLGSDLVGSSNISPMLLDMLEMQLDSILSELTKVRDYSAVVGPQLTDYEILSLYQDTVDQSHIYASFSCTPPRPFNKFHMLMRII